MGVSNSFPRDLARHLRGHVPKSHKPLFSVRMLTEFLECAYFSSMKTEESHGITCTIALVDYAKPDSDPPPRIRAQRPRFMRFGAELAYNTKTLVKLAQAADPEASEIAVAVNPGGELVIIGLIDQELQFRRSLNHEDGASFGRLGVFQVEITGVGILAVYRGATLVGGLRQNALAASFLDALHDGPIAKLLLPYISRAVSRVKEEVGPDFSRTVWWSFDDWESLIREKWLGVLSRILLTIQRYGHGGALLLLPKESTTDLSVKYALTYDVLESAIVQDAVSDIRQRLTWWTVHDDYAEAKKELMPTKLYFDVTIAFGDRRDAIESIDGAIAFIASLSRVDGLIAMAGGFKVFGFGGEITRKKDPPAVYAAGNANASVNKMRKQDAKHWGTRHRSMMRYCFAHPGSLGFVVSQDGDVRAVARVGNRLVIWEQLRLQDLALPTAPG